MMDTASAPLTSAQRHGSGRSVPPTTATIHAKASDRTTSVKRWLTSGVSAGQRTHGWTPSHNASTPA